MNEMNKMNVMDKRNTIKTGDVLLFSGNTATGFLLRTFVSSEWNHSGIAVRFKTDPITQKKTVSLTEEGDLFVLETNTGIRKDAVFNVDVVGAGFSTTEWTMKRYNRLAVRRLHDVFRTTKFAELTMDFANKYRGNQFPSSGMPFISVWLGIQLTEKNKNEMFCSELMAHYYLNCIGSQYEKLTGRKFDGNLSTLFGTEVPLTEDMITPGHYASLHTPNASIFNGTDEVVYIVYADLLYVILQPLLIILVIMLALWLSFQ